tara:strand:+ start:918 stop:1103 length:186 start_codon:yes stop_codon:yes gene_type:complete
MPLITDPNTGDPFLDILIAVGGSDRTINQLANETAAYVRSLTPQERREYSKLIKRLSKRNC